MDNMRPMPPAERAKKRLTAFKDLRQSIDYKTERLAMMEEKLGSIGSPQISDMPKAPSYGGNDRRRSSRTSRRSGPSTRRSC